MRVVISRDEWIRGDGGTASALWVRPADATYEDEGQLSPQLCCLGHLGRACGVTDGDMVEVAVPSDLSMKLSATFPEALFCRSNEAFLEGRIADPNWEGAFVAVNDAEDVDDATREAWLIEGFRVVLGVDLEFVDGAP